MTDTESAQPGVTAEPSRPAYSGHHAGGRTLGLSRPRGRGAEVNVIAMLGGVLSALTGHASDYTMSGFSD